MANSAKLSLNTVDGDGLRFDAVAGSGTAAVLDSGANMAAPSPIEMLLVSLAGCSAMDVISILRKKRQRVTAYSVDVLGERRTEHPRSYTRIAIMHRFRGHDLSAAAVARAIELSHTKYCSVQGSLDPAIAVTHEFDITQEMA